MNLSQQQISYILSLYAYKNFGKAAEACFVTQPTLSMQIKKAEETLGFQIFNRNRSPLELTVYGQKLLPILYDMQAEYEKVIRLSKLNKGQITEELKVYLVLSEKRTKRYLKELTEILLSPLFLKTNCIVI